MKREKFLVFLVCLLILCFHFGSSEAGTMPKVGGSGGTKTATAECPSGEYAIGIEVRYGIYMNAIRLRCGNKSGWTRDTSFAGATGGSSQNRSNCSSKLANGVIRGFRGKSDVYVDCIYGEDCVTPDFKKYDYAPLSWSGSPGGIAYSAACPSGEVLYKVVVKYGLWMDSYQGYCRNP